MCLTAQEKIRNRINIKNKTAGHAGIACFSFALKGNRAGSPHFKIVRFKWWEHVTGQYSTDYGALFAATAISIIPVLLIYLFFQKQFIAGIAASAVKG